MGIDKALIEEYPNENTFKRIEKRARVLSLSGVWGGRCQLLRAVLYLHDNLGDSIYTWVRAALCPSDEIILNTDYFVFLPTHWFDSNRWLGPYVTVILIMVLVLYFMQTFYLNSSQSGLERNSVSLLLWPRLTDLKHHLPSSLLAAGELRVDLASQNLTGS